MESDLMQDPAALPVAEPPIPEPLPVEEPEVILPEPPANKTLAAEALAAVVGIVPSDPLTEADGVVARKLPEKFRAKVRQFLRDDPKPVVHAPLVDMEKTLEVLTEPVDDLDQTLGDVSDGEIGTAVLDVITRGRQYVAARWPTIVLQQVTGPELLPVSLREQQTASALFRVVDEPLQILDEMLARSLEAQQAAAFRAVYPTLAQMLDEILWEEIMALGKGKRVSWDREQVLRVLWNVPPQQRITTPRASAPSPGASGGTPADKQLEKLTTKAQRLNG